MESTVVIRLALLLVISTAMAMVSNPLPDCGEELLAISPCLSYVGLPPNNFSSTVSPLCCESIGSTHNGCLCHLLRQPLLLGFPLNTSRFTSVFSLCANATAPDSLQDFCQENRNLSPLQSPQGSGPSSTSSTPGSSFDTSEPHLSPTEPQFNSTTSTSIKNGTCWLTADSVSVCSTESHLNSTTSTATDGSTCWFLTGALLLVCCLTFINTLP